jgi:hypothetical protein
MIQNQHISEKDNRATTIGNPTAVNLIINGEKYPAYLNDSRTAKELISKLPYTVSVSQGMHDYCGVMEHLDYNDEDVQDGWFNGDIAFDISGDWFVIFLRGENNSSQYREVNLGQLASQADIKKIAGLPTTIQVTIELAK